MGLPHVKRSLPLGYDFRAWNLSSLTNNSVQFSLLDPDGFMGFPGTVQTNVTYSLLSGGKYSTEFHSEVLPGANGTRPETPIMLSTHNYWNLECVFSLYACTCTHLDLPSADTMFSEVGATTTRPIRPRRVQSQAAMAHTFSSSTRTESWLWTASRWRPANSSMSTIRLSTSAGPRA